MRFHVALRLAIAAVFAFQTCAQADPNILGVVTLARTHGNAMVLWDCTDELVSMVNAKESHDEMLHKLESDAIDVMSEKAPLVKTTAKTVTVQVIYQKIGSVNPQYGQPALAGVERLVSLTGPIDAIASKGKSWSNALAKGNTPSDIKLQMLGQLP